MSYIASSAMYTAFVQWPENDLDHECKCFVVAVLFDAAVYGTD